MGGDGFVSGLTQIIYQGTPISSCLPVVGTAGSCQWAEGRGDFVALTRAANGDIVKGQVEQGKRTPAYIQTDLAFRHDIAFKRSRENMALSFEANVANLLNQRVATIYYEFVVPTNTICPARASRLPGDPQIDWGRVMNVFNYIDALNATGAFSGNAPGTATKIQAPLTLANRYGMPSGFQTARAIRLTVRFAF